MTGEDPRVNLYLLSYNREYQMQSLHVCACICGIDKIYIYVEEIYKPRDIFLATGYMLQHAPICFFLNATEKQIL